jgi:hypothetical protein
LIAYNVDIYDISTNKNGYVIVSNSVEDEPIIQMSDDSNSVYDKTVSNSDKCVFDGVGSYFVKDTKTSNGKYYELETRTQLTDDVVETFKAGDKRKVHMMWWKHLKQATSVKSINQQIFKKFKQKEKVYQVKRPRFQPSGLMAHQLRKFT